MKVKTVAAILRRSGFKKALVSDKVTSVIASLKSTHDAVFVFDKKGKFCGVVNLYHSFLKKKADFHEKVERCLFSPPLLTRLTTIEEAARLMVESRLYLLPVVEEENFLGVVFVEDILKWARKRKIFERSISRSLVLKPPAFIDFTKTVAQALELMIDEKTSRLIVTDKEGRAVGMLTLYDLRQFLAKPEEKLSLASMVPIKKEFAGQKVDKFYHRTLFSVNDDAVVSKAAALMKENGIGSVVVFSYKNPGKPIGLISLRGLLKMIISRNEVPSQVSTSRAFGKESLQLAKTKALEKLEQILKTNSQFAHKIKTVSLDLREIAKGKKSDRLPLLEATARVRLSDRNQTLFTKVRGRKVVFLVDKVIHKIKSLLGRR